jgi:DNA invertase Pin-like site-specific DNA recombinase
MLTDASKLRREHVDRLAAVYVRQSSAAQVRKNTESTARQYALADEATRLGWDAANILVLDGDQALSGRTAAGRAAFKELVSRVCTGEVGAIFGLEVSRFARSSADLQRLLEFCSITDTLVIDVDGTYDLTHFNDRLLLGLKCTMAEAELHLLAGRLQESKRAAAQRGELRLRLPVGYAYDADGHIGLDPDEAVRAVVAEVFATFTWTGSAFGVVQAFRDRPFPGRRHDQAWTAPLRWGCLTYSRALSILANPTYAGAYVYGRQRARRAVDPDGTIRIKVVAQRRAEWAIVIRDHHPAYIPWETFVANEQRLDANCSAKGARPPREGGALLQGIVRCGSCGRGMSTNHHNYRTGAAYYCAHAQGDGVATPQCRWVPAKVVDAAVAARLLDLLTPHQIALALAAADEVTERRSRSTRTLELQVERTRFEAARAEEAFHQCDPKNRLVVRTLEARWEDKLKALAAAEKALAAAQTPVASLPPRAELEALASDLSGLWHTPTTADKDRKRLLRALVADVTVLSESGDQIHVGIRWRSGATEALVVARPPLPWRTPPGAVELIRRLQEKSNGELVRELAAAGFATGGGRPFDHRAVRWVRRAYGIPAPPEPRLAPGEMTVAEVARQLDVPDDVVYYLIARRQLPACRGSNGRLCVAFSSEVDHACRQWMATSTHLKRRTRTPTIGGAV